MWLRIVLIGLACCGARAVWHEDFGPWINATRGEVFPRPSYKFVENDFRVVRPNAFNFNIIGHTCDILEDAVERYRAIIMEEARVAWKAGLTIPKSYVHQDVNMRGDLDELVVKIHNPCERLPHDNMKENYTLKILKSENKSILMADDVWGALRGLETFSQLLIQSSDGQLTIKCQIIRDSPRFHYRGLLLDTSRHYLPVSDILLTLDAMSYNKLNVFHWHIVDDNSFPYVSAAYPELSAKGAYHQSMVYTPANVRKIIEHARLRGIRVVPEFDTPAHSKSWGQAHPELLTECWVPGRPSGKLGPLNPTKPETLTFVKTLLTEIFQLFPDRYFHLGGDEILFDCWASNPDIIAYMKKHNFRDGDFPALEAEYFRKVFQILASANVSPIVWQEVFSNVQNLSAEAVVQIWTGSWKELMVDVLKRNHSAILSACWYLDALSSGGDWIKYYQCDPLSFNGTEEMKQRVLGGEACMWGEFVDRTNVHSRIWPRACAAAERLWSDEADTIDGASQRLEEHTCRMNRRGIPAQPPNGSGFCVL